MIVKKYKRYGRTKEYRAENEEKALIKQPILRLLKLKGVW